LKCGELHHFQRYERLGLEALKKRPAKTAVARSGSW